MKKSIPVALFVFIFVNIILAQQDISFYAKGMEYFNNGDYSRAATTFQKYISQSDVDENLLSSAKLYIGESLLGLEQYDGAIAQYEEFLDKFPTSYLREIALYRLGNLYYDKKLFDKSRNNLAMLVKQFPNSEYVGSAYHLIGETFIEENNLDKAEKFFNSAVNSKYSNAFEDHSIFALANVYEKKGEYEKAVKYYDKILGFHRKSPIADQAQLRIGICYFHLKDYDNAILELSDPLIQELDTDDRNNADYILANSFYRLKEYDEASKAYKRILNNSPSDQMMDKIRYGLAWINFQQGDYENAYKLFNLLSYAKDDSIALKSFYWSGEAKRYEGKIDEAIEIHKRFALKYPNHPLAQRVRLNIGISKFTEDDYQESEEALIESLTRSDPFTKSKSYTLLGEINLRKKDYRKAKEFFQKGLNIVQIPAELKDRCLLGLGVANFYLKNNIEAIKNFNSINEKETEIDKNKLKFYRAEANFYLGNYLKSVSDYLKIKTDNTQMKNDVIYGLAYSYFDIQDFNKASYYFTDFLKSFPNDKRNNECLLRLGDCYYAQKEFGKASVYYKKSLIDSDEFSNDDRSFFNYAQSLFKAGNLNDAISVLEQLQLKFPASSYADDSQYLIGWINFQRNKFDEAIQSYKTLTERYPQSVLIPIAFYSIGDSYFNKGEYDNAISSYDNLITKYPNTHYVYDAVNGIQYCYVVQDQQQNAINYLKNFITNHPNSNYLDKIQLKIGEIYYSNGNYIGAIDAYQKVINEYPKSDLIYQSYYWMAKSENLIGKPAEAIPYFNLVINSELNTEVGFNSVMELGRIYRTQKNIDKEIALYDEVIPKIKDQKRTTEIKFAKAQSYIANQQIPQAYNALQEIVNYRDGSLFYHKAEIELGLLEQNNENYDNAYVLFKDVADNRTDDIAAKALYYIGLNYYKQHKIPEAITELIKLRSVYSMYDEWYTKTLLLLGDCYVINNDKANASEMYKAVLKRHRNNQYAQEANEKLNQL